MSLRLINITLQVAFFGTIIGALVSLLSLGFVYGVKVLSDFREGLNYCSLELFSVCFSYLPVLFLLVSAIIIIIVKKTLQIARYHGPADVILSAHSPTSNLDLKTGFLSTFAAFVSASGGASVGQYGPLVHLGGTIATLINKITPRLLSKDIFIGCGVAAAISAGFNSPIGGIIFAHEAILRHFSFKAIAPIAVSSVVASTLTNYFFPLGILFQDTDSEIGILSSVSLSLLLGPFCAIIAVLFMKSLLSLQKNANKISSNELIRILLAGIICGLIGGFIPEVLGLGGKAIGGIIENSFSLIFIIFILVLKFFVTVLCLSLGFFGGVFSPALVLGASIGGIFTYFGNFFGFNALGDSLILAGMAALSASVIGAPIASIVIIFELTHSYDLAFVSIICVAGSCLISSILFGHSFFDKQLLNRNFMMSRGRTDILLSERTIKSLLGKNDFLTARVGSQKKYFINILKNSEFTEVYLVDADDRLKGKLKVNDLINPEKTDLIGDTNPLRIEDNSNIAEAIVKASNFIGESIPVTDPDGKLLGVVTEADLFSEYLRVQDQISKIEKD